MTQLRLPCLPPKVARCPACHRPQRLHGRVVAGVWVQRISPHFHPRLGKLPRLCAFSGSLGSDAVYLGPGRRVPALTPGGLPVDSRGYWLAAALDHLVERWGSWARGGGKAWAGCVWLAGRRAV